VYTKTGTRTLNITVAEAARLAEDGQKWKLKISTLWAIKSATLLWAITSVFLDKF